MYTGQEKNMLDIDILLDNLATKTQKHILSNIVSKPTSNV